MKISHDLIQNLRKKAIPNDPFSVDEDGIYRVDATATVPIELSLEGIKEQGLAGVDFVFLIDNSGSMKTNDPDKLRFYAIRDLAASYMIGRESIDRVSIVVFCGDINGSDTEVWMNWSSWSETELFMSEYLEDNSVHPPKAGGLTPMTKGMQKANAQFIDSNKPYKLVIMLSDGSSEPDFYGQQGEIQSVHVPFARENEIIYSPVLLGAGEDGASGLLDKIALETDYISDSLYFSFRAATADEIKEKFDGAITGVSTRIVPKRIILVEKVNQYLEVVNASLMIEENEFSQNQIDPITPLSNAINTFKNTGRFYIKFTELVGEIILRFDIKLRLLHVPEEALQEEYFEVSVDNIIDSSITFNHPI